jgi:hypothetical protein
MASYNETVVTGCSYLGVLKRRTVFQVVGSGAHEQWHVRREKEELSLLIRGKHSVKGVDAPCDLPA